MAKMKVNFGRAAHYFEGGNNNSATAEQDVAEKAAKKAKRIKIAKWTGIGVGTALVGIVTFRGIKKLVNKHKEQEVPAPEEEQPAVEQPTSEEKPVETKKQKK